MYIVAGWGSMAIQVIVAVVIAAPVLMGIYWKRIKAWLSKKQAVLETPQDK